MLKTTLTLLVSLVLSIHRTSACVVGSFLLDSCGVVNQTTTIRAYAVYDHVYMYEFYVNWGEDAIDYYAFNGTDSPASNDGRDVNFTHVYDKAGDYDISITAIGHHNTSGNSPCIKVTQGEEGDWVLQIRQNYCSELKGSGAAGENKLKVMAVATFSLLISGLFL